MRMKGDTKSAEQRLAEWAAKGGANDGKMICCGENGCGQELTFDPHRPSMVEGAKPGGMVGHAEDCGWVKRVRANLLKSHEQWTRIGEQVAEARRQRLEAMANAVVDEETGETRAQAAARRRKERLEAPDEDKTLLAEKGTCKHGHDLTREGYVDHARNNVIVCRQCKRDAAERHKLKKKGVKT